MLIQGWGRASSEASIPCEMRMGDHSSMASGSVGRASVENSIPPRMPVVDVSVSDYQ